MPGSSAYPASLDNFAAASPTNLGDNDTTGRTHSERHDDMEAAVEAVQAELGTDPAGASATVKARFDAIEANSWVTTARIADDAVTSPKLALQYANAAALPTGAVGDFAFQTDVEAPLVKRATGWKRITPRSALYLPGTTGNGPSCPDSASLSITGDIDIRLRLAADDWTPSANACMIGKRNATASYQLVLRSTGGLRFNWGDSGTGTLRTLDSSAATGFTDGTAHWVRVAFDADNGAGGCTAYFYTSDDGSNWTLLGTAQTAATVAAINDTTETVQIGERGSGNDLFIGKVYQGEIRSGIGGTVVASPDFRLPVGPRHRDAQGNVWTFNGSAWSWSVEDSA